jgi:hypothetical protein
MALFNEILVGRYNRFLTKLFGMKGGPPTPQLSGEITPSIPLFSGVENRYLESWERFAVLSNQVGVAAQTCGVRFRNPTANNLMVVLEALWCFGLTTADQPTLQNSISNVADLATLQNPAQLDGRSRPNSSLIVSQQTAASVALTGARTILVGAYAAGNTPFQFIIMDDTEITITPGMTYQVTAGGANIGMAVSAIWRERFLEQSETT